MIPDGWVLVIPMLPNGVQVAAFRSKDHAAQIFAGLGGEGGGTIMQPIFFVPDERS